MGLRRRARGERCDEPIAECRGLGRGYIEGVRLNVQALTPGAPEPSAAERGERALNCPICRGGGWSLPDEIRPTTSRFFAADADRDPE